MTTQELEITTIRERTFKIKLSDADCNKITKLCGEHSITVSQLIENFIGDLVCGTYTNGSDERDFVRRWFNRCWFGIFPEQTLLSHLIVMGYAPEDYLYILSYIKELKEEKECLAEHPEDADEASQYLDDNIAEKEERLIEMRTDWIPEREPNLKEEVALIEKWVQEKYALIDE